MYLFELFDDTTDDDEAGDLVHKLRQTAMDMLLPLAAKGIPFVTLNSIIEELSKMRTGVAIDNSIVMQVLDPDKVKLISKIEGDRVYFTSDKTINSASSPDQEEKDEEHIKNKATAQAKKNLAK